MKFLYLNFVDFNDGVNNPVGGYSSRASLRIQRQAEYRILRFKIRRLLHTPETSAPAAARQGSSQSTPQEAVQIIEFG